MSGVSAWKTEMKELAPGVYAYIQSEGTWFISNAGLILGEEEAIVVDSLTNKRMVEDFLKQIEGVTDKPIRFLVNTHFHGDHIYTNHFFTEATKICDSTTRKLTEESSSQEIELYSQIWPDVDFTGSKITSQDMAFEDRAAIYLGNKEAQMISVGPAHTPSDVFVYLPKEEVVFCGDLLFYRCTPFALMGYISGYIRALERLAELNAKVYVPGHGPTCGKEGLYEVREYLVMVRDEAHERFEEDVSYYEAAKDIDLGKFGDWADSERIVGNVARAYSEFKGEPKAGRLNYEEIIPKMLQY